MNSYYIRDVLLQFIISEGPEKITIEIDIKIGRILYDRSGFFKRVKDKKKDLSELDLAIQIEKGSYNGESVDGQLLVIKDSIIKIAGI